MTDVFISYAHENAAFAGRVRDGLESGGVSTWMDTAAMAPGDRYTADIDAAIEAAPALVVVVSAASKTNEWVTREVLAAKQFGKRVIPVRAQDVPLPTLLVDLLALDLHGDFDAGLVRLLGVLRGEAGTDPGDGAVPSGAGSGRAAAPTARLVVLGAGLLVAVAGVAVGALVLLGLSMFEADAAAAPAIVVLTGLVFALVVGRLAWNADGSISTQFRRDVSLSLDRADPASVGAAVQRWPTQFAALFDSVFGHKHLHWRCFYRSCIASLVALVLATFIYAQAAPAEWAHIKNAAASGQSMAFFWYLAPVWKVGLYFAALNLIPDYLSLLETRLVIRRMESVGSALGQLAWLAFDFVATLAIFLLPVLALGLVESLSIVDTIRKVLGAGVLSKSVAIDSRVMAVLLWTTFFTSVWVWVYFVAQQLTRLASPMRRGVAFLQYLLPLERRPLRSVGQVMALVACAGYWALMLPLATVADEVSVEVVQRPELVTLPAGAFPMGSPGDEPGRWDDEGPQHLVHVGSFAMSRHEVTFDEYDQFARATRRMMPGDYFNGRGKRPVVDVSWHDARAYVRWLSEKTGEVYRLPTEAEWEYAARARTTTARFWGEDPERGECLHANVFDSRNAPAVRARYPDVSWQPHPCEDTFAFTAPVGSFEANDFELHDMLGNVWEWVEDCWHDSYEGAPVDGSAWGEAGGGDCVRRVLRGGSWFYSARLVRSAVRDRNGPVVRNFFVGFRLAQDS